MSDKALENAMGRRDELAGRINQAQQQIDEWRRELGRVNQFIQEWHDFAGVPMPIDVTREPARTGLVQLPMVPPAQEEVGVVDPDKPKRARNNSRKEEVAEGARAIITERGQPVLRADLLKALRERGYVIEGSDPDTVLSTMLWRMRDRVARVKTGGYWLAEVPCPDAGYEPVPEGGGQIDLVNLESDGSPAIEA